MNSNRTYMHGYHLPCKWFFYSFFLSPLSTSDSPHFIFLIPFLNSLSLINILSFHQTLSFHQINFLTDQRYRPKPHCRFVGFFFPHHQFVGRWLFFCCGGLFLLGCSLGCVGFDWSLVSILCGFRLFRWWLCGFLGCFRSVRDDRVWVVLGLWERWHC